MGSGKARSGGGGNSFKTKLCSSKMTTNSDDYEDDVTNYYSNEKNYLFCGIMCTKSMVIIFNFFFILSGIFLILFGAWTIWIKQEYVELLSSILYQLFSYILIGTGVLIIVTGIIGILSAWFEAKKYVIVFILLLLLVVFIECVVGVTAFVYKIQLNHSLKNDLETLILNEYNENGFESKSKLLDEIQVKFKCCGASSYVDWRMSKYVQAQNTSTSDPGNINLVAESCCKTPSKLCAKRTHPSNINYQGCVTPLEKYLSHHLLLVSMVSISAWLIQSIGFFLGALLVRRINQRKQYNHLSPNEST